MSENPSAVFALMHLHPYMINGDTCKKPCDSVCVEAPVELKVELELMILLILLPPCEPDIVDPQDQYERTSTRRGMCGWLATHRPDGVLTYNRIAQYQAEHSPARIKEHTIVVQGL